jgi:hypothetical protein
MQFLDESFFGGAKPSGIVGSGMDTTSFAVVFLPSSRRQAIFLTLVLLHFLQRNMCGLLIRLEGQQQHVLYHYPNRNITVDAAQHGHPEKP